MKCGCVTTVSGSSASRSTTSGGATLACSMRSPGRPPAAAKAAVASTSSARVTQCTATGRFWACACAMLRSSSSKRGRSCSASTSFRAPRSAPGVLRGRKLCAPHHHEALAQLAALERGDEGGELGLRVAVGRIRHARDAEGGELSAHLGQIRHLGGAEPLAQPGVEAMQPARGPPIGAALDAAGVAAGVEAELGNGGGVHHPERAAAVLNAHGAVGREIVERAAVEVAGHGLVIADAADPAGRRARGA